MLTSLEVPLSFNMHESKQTNNNNNKKQNQPASCKWHIKKIIDFTSEAYKKQNKKYKKILF